MLSLSQLIAPAPTEYWQQVLLNALQGVGYVTQSSPSGQLQGTGSVTVSGPATQASDVVVLIGPTGNVGTGTFTFSLDGGASYSGSLTIPSGASGNSGRSTHPPSRRRRWGIFPGTWQARSARLSPRPWPPCSPASSPARSTWCAAAMATPTR